MTKVHGKPGMSAMDRGRLGKALDRRYRFDSGVMTLGQFLESHTVTAKSSETQTHSNKRVGLEYRQLTEPKTAYYIIVSGGDMYEVPKLVYDCLDAEPEPVVAPYTFSEYQTALIDKLRGSGVEWIIQADWSPWRAGYAWLWAAPIAEIVLFSLVVDSTAWNGREPEHITD